MSNKGKQKFRAMSQTALLGYFYAEDFGRARVLAEQRWGNEVVAVFPA